MSDIRAERDGAVGVITIDRRPRFNSLDVETSRDLRKAALAFARDEGIRVIVLTGAGGVFCSGADLKYIKGGGDTRSLSYLAPAARTVTQGYGEVFKQILEYLHSTISELRRSPKPVLAAVDGMAAAGGLGLAMACDLVYASSRASFEWAYSKTGLTGAESSTFILPRLIGFRRSLELLLLNPRIDPPRALELGLVTAVIAAEGDDFLARVLDVARTLAAGPVHAYGVAKGLMNQAAGIDRLDHHLDVEIDELVRSADGEEFREGLAAFLEKRAARYA